jgi:hypothetical protein
MNHINKIVDWIVYNKGYNIVHRKSIYTTGYLTVQNPVLRTVRQNVWLPVFHKIFNNHTSFHYNSIQQYKNNL